MKSIVMPKNVQISDEIKRELLHEVKETLDAGIGIINKKRFTAGDMWKLQRNARSASDMIRR